jgi:hypothetical protein
MTHEPDLTTDSAQRQLRLTGHLHLQPEPDGNAVVVDDRTLSAARVNKAACVLITALRQPRTRADLATVLADVAHCEVGEAAGAVDRFVEELIVLGWIEN